MLLNSHLIGEVERVCDRVVILDRGRVAASGTLAELLGQRELRLQLTDLSPAAEARLAATGDVERAGDWFTVALPADDDGTAVPDLVRDLVALGARVHAVEPARISLEERLLGILRDGADAGRRRPVTTARTVLTIAALTLREASRRRVLLALAVLTVVLLALSGWGFSRLAAESGGSALTSGEARLTASILLNLVMFGFSLIAALGTAFLAGPTLAGETESGIALAVLARPIRRSAVPAGQVAGAGGVRQRLRRRSPGWPSASSSGRRWTTGRRTRRPPSRCSRRRRPCCSPSPCCCRRPISPMASGVVAVGLFGATWVAGVVGGIGASLGNDAVARVGTVSRMLLPTDGLWRGAMHAFQDPSALVAVRRLGRRGLPVPERGAADGRLPRVGRGVGGDGLGAGGGVLPAQGPLAPSPGVSSGREPGSGRPLRGPGPAGGRRAGPPHAPAPAA